MAPRRVAVGAPVAGGRTQHRGEMDERAASTSSQHEVAGWPARTRVVVGRLDSLGGDEIAELDGHLARGGSLLLAPEAGDAVAARLAGVAVARDLPEAEWMLSLGHRREADRLDPEVAVSCRLRLLDPSAGDAAVAVAATASVAMRQPAVITLRTAGAGRVVASGVADLYRLAAEPVLGRFVARLLRTDPPEERGPIGVGIVGYGPHGGMGYSHGLACAETEGLRLVAVADTAPERLAAAERDFPGIRSYPGVDELAGDDAVELAIVATPPASHARLVLDLLGSGRHVVVEKPMCLTVGEADRLVAEAARVGRMLTVNQSRRWDRDFLALAEVIASGSIGEVFNIETFVGDFDHPCRLWHSDEVVSGGAVYDWGSHHVDWVLRLYGSPPARVAAIAHKRAWLDVTNADQVTAWMQWADGREATFRQSDLAAIRRPKFYVQGTRGTIEGHYRKLVNEEIEPGRGYVERLAHFAEAPVTLRLARYEGPGRLSETAIPPAPAQGWAFHRNVADHLLLGEPLLVHPAESRDVVAVLEAAHRSAAAGGRTVEVG
jgi:predicted dehydrogenase